MVTQEQKKILQKASPQSIMLGKKALQDLSQTRRTDIKCPICGESPVIIMISDSRIIVKCKCKYICNMEISL